MDNSYYNSLYERVKNGEIATPEAMAEDMIQNGKYPESDRFRANAFCSRVFGLIKAEGKSGINFG